MRLQEVLRFIMQNIWTRKNHLYNSISINLWNGEPILHYFYQHAIVRYKSLLKQRIIAIPNIEAIAWMHFGNYLQNWRFVS